MAQLGQQFLHLVWRLMVGQGRVYSIGHTSRGGAHAHAVAGQQDDGNLAFWLVVRHWLPPALLQIQ